MNILAGDLGGTKTLLSIYKLNGHPVKIHEKRYISAEWDSFDLIISNFFNNIPKNIDLPIHGCIGIAGRVINNSCKITNLKWELNSEKIRKLAGLDSLELINDFAVLIYGIKYLNKTQYITIQNPDGNNLSKNNGLIAILGAGTGLGIARGLITSNGIKVLPSEGGHREFSPRSEDEWNLSKWLKNDLKIQRLSLERIVSGTGLGHIARWLLNQPEAKFHPLREIVENYQKNSPNNLDLSAIASEAAQNGDKLMSKALRIWLSAYGSAAGDLALQELCNRGLWISGGTASKHLEGLKSITFKEAFSNKGRFKTFLEKLPVMAITDPDIGLFSASCRAQQLSNKMGNLS